MTSAADRSATELCTVLLDNFFGPAVSKVCSILLSYGRLEAVTISRRAELSPKLTRQSLAVMIQHNVVRFSTSSDAGNERTHYECDWQEVLRLLKTGKVMWWASKEVSPEAAALVKYISIYGKAKASDIRNAFISSNSSLVDGSKEFDALLLQLVQRKVLRVVALHESRPEEDFKQSIRNEELRLLNNVSMPESKKLKEIEENMQKRLKGLRDGANSNEAGLKRKADVQDVGRARKRMRTDDSEGRVVDPEVMLRVNHEKYLVFQRNEDLAALCHTRLGASAGTVYRHILKELEPRIFNCQQNTSDLVITTLTISRMLPKGIDLASVWAADSHIEGKSKSRSKAKINGKTHHSHEDDSDESMDEDDDASDADSFIENDVNELASDEEYGNDNATTQNGVRIKNINKFCDLFASDSLAFMTKLGSRSMGEWTIDYERLGSTLRQLEIETMIQQKFGDLAPRLLRVVKDKVKIDEKQLSTIALLKQKDIRHILTSLHESGVLELQEVPKRLDRQPSMTFFLWCHNPERACHSLAQEICRTMARIHQRLQHELQGRKRLLDKSQRTDVRNKESEYLSKQELAELRKIRQVEEKLLAQSARLANSYSILVEY